ncbi:hypothetical protein JZ751_007660, partial [Albula glossodonta]
EGGSVCWYLKPITRKSSQDTLVVCTSFIPFRQASSLHFALALFTTETAQHSPMTSCPWAGRCVFWVDTRMVHSRSPLELGPAGTLSPYNALR